MSIADTAVRLELQNFQADLHSHSIRMRNAKLSSAFGQHAAFENNRSFPPIRVQCAHLCCPAQDERHRQSAQPMKEIVPHQSLLSQACLLDSARERLRVSAVFHFDI